MTRLSEMSVLRAGDRAVLGRITGHVGSFHAYLSGITDPLDQQEFLQHHRTLDAAVHAIQDNPHVPDPTVCPNIEGVFGPVLAVLGVFRVVGIVHAFKPSLARGLGHKHALLQDILAVVHDDGPVVARLGKRGTTWVVEDCTGERLVTRRRTRFADAVILLRSTLVARCPGSMHARMRLLEESLDLAALAADFMDAQATLRSMPGTVCPNVIVEHTSVIRTEDSFCLGFLGSQDGVITAGRTTELRFGESRAHDSFDAAVAWLEDSPFRPDLVRFPIHGSLYGPVLGITPTAMVVGVVGDNSWFSSEKLVLCLMNSRKQVVASLFKPPGTDIYTVSASIPGPSSFETLDAAVDAIVQEMLLRHGASDRKARNMRTTITAFLRDRMQLVQDFRAGQGPHPA